jgi:hypothetical protein
MKLKIRSWHNSEKEIKGLASVGLKDGDVFYPHLHPRQGSKFLQPLPAEDPTDWILVVLEIYGTGLNVMLAHSSEPGSIMVGVSDDLFKQR